MATNKAIWNSGDALPTLATLIENPVANGFTFTLVDDYINLSFSMTADANSYEYVDITSVTDYTVVAGDYLEYDIWWDGANYQIAMDTDTTDNFPLRGSTATDGLGFLAHPSTDLSVYPIGRWYHRRIPLTYQLGKTINVYSIVCENNGSGTITGRIKNMNITDGAGTTTSTSSSTSSTSTSTSMSTSTSLSTSSTSLSSTSSSTSLSSTSSSTSTTTILPEYFKPSMVQANSPFKEGLRR